MSQIFVTFRSELLEETWMHTVRSFFNTGIHVVDVLHLTKIAESTYKCPNSKWDMLVNEARTPTNYLAFVPFTSPYGHNQCLLALTVPGQHHLHNCMYYVHWNTLPSLSVNKFCVCVTNLFVDTDKLHTQWFKNSRYMNKNYHHINARPFVNCEFTTTHFSDGEIHTNWYY